MVKQPTDPNEPRFVELGRSYVNWFEFRQPLPLEDIKEWAGKHIERAVNFTIKEHNADIEGIKPEDLVFFLEGGFEDNICCVKILRKETEQEIGDRLLDIERKKQAAKKRAATLKAKKTKKERALYRELEKKYG